MDPGIHNDDSFADRILRDAQANLCGGIDLENAGEANRKILESLGKQAELLSQVEYVKDKKVTCPSCQNKFTEPWIDVALLSKNVNHLAKSLDAVARLTAFLKGDPDSRPDLAGKDVLACLTPPQVTVLMGYLDENERALRS